MASGNAGSGGRGGKMVWKEEEMFRWQIDADAIAMKRGFVGILKLVNFQFQQSMETGGERLSWEAWASWEKLAFSKNKSLIIGLQTLNSEGVGSKSDSVPEERLSLKVENAVGTKIFEGAACKSTHCIRLGGKCQDSYYSWTTMNLTEERFHELQIYKGINVTFILKTKSPIVEKIYWPSEVAVKEKFYKMITKLENDEEKSDLKIISSDGKEFFACRWILVDVSEVFEAMFRSEMKEKQSGVLKLDDLCGTTVKTLLHFIYTGEVAREWSGEVTVQELIYAADKYQIKELKKFLDANLGKVCTAENAGNLLYLAEKTSLKKAVADILALNGASGNNARIPRDFLRSLRRLKLIKNLLPKY